MDLSKASDKELEEELGRRVNAVQPDGRRHDLWYPQHTRQEWYANGGKNPRGYTARQLTGMFDRSIGIMVCARYGNQRLLAQSHEEAIKVASDFINEIQLKDFRETLYFPEDEKPKFHLPFTTDAAAGILAIVERTPMPQELHERIISHAFDVGRSKQVMGEWSESRYFGFAEDFFNSNSLPLFSEEFYDELRQTYLAAFESSSLRGRRKIKSKTSQ